MPLNNLAFKELINIIENPKNLAVLQHCTSGKDRTGLGSALILLLLGVPEEKVIEDYMLSNELEKEKIIEYFKFMKSMYQMKP